MKNLTFTILILLFLMTNLFGYIGPGAGFAFMSSFMFIFGAIIVAILIVLIWPIRYIIKKLKYDEKKLYSNYKKIIVVGFDGLCPVRVKNMLEQGSLPNIKNILDNGGTFKKLKTTIPSISPVAWSSFSTGVNPGKHNIYDFLTRDKDTYMSILSSTRIDSPSRHIKIGKYKVPLGKAGIRLMKKSKTFWKICGENGILTNVIRVPITFPPEKYNGLQLSAMCVPDLLGTQGTFTYYTTNKDEISTVDGGRVILLNRDNGLIKTTLKGPVNEFKEPVAESEINLLIKPLDNKLKLSISNNDIILKKNEYSDWIKVEFKFAPFIKVSGIVRFYLVELDKDIKLYVTPININPESPVLPISNPSVYSAYLSKRFGYYATLGLAEDTWALNENVIDEKAFLEQTELIDNERKKMLFDGIKHLKKGLLVCVFDNTDRIQHTFWRYIDPLHPANTKRENEKYKNVINDMYVEADKTIGKVIDKIDEDTLLMVMSDHGFASFRYGVNLNSWLYKEGYIVLKDNKTESGEWFEGVDWSKTKAYAVGLGGIFLNRAGREKEGILNSDDDIHKLKIEICDKLKKLYDNKNNEYPVLDVFDSDKVYHGPYKNDGPDLFVGFKKNYRASWDCAKGIVNDIIIDNNYRAWSGDHSIHPDLVPGTFLCNRNITDEEVSIIDIAPTVLELFNIKVPKFIDGNKLTIEKTTQRSLR